MVKIVTVASWEPRFHLGLSDFLSSQQCELLITFFFDGFASRTSSYRNELKSRNCDFYKEVELPFGDSLKAWHFMSDILKTHIAPGDKVVFDITTAPRDALFSILYILRSLDCDLGFIYHRPESYGDWLSRDSCRPELIFKMSGIFSLNKPTLLLFMPGYDTERMQQLLVRHEPHKIVLGLQDGEQYNSVVRCRRTSIATIANLNLVADCFDYNAYSSDFGLDSIQKAVAPYYDQYNILACTLGPKPSSIALFHLHQLNQRIGLIYVRSKDYNINYSAGYSERVSGTVAFNRESFSCINHCAQR